MTHPPLYYCSFCGQSQREVEVMFTVGIASICSECVEFCGELLAERRAETKQKESGDAAPARPS